MYSLKAVFQKEPVVISLAIMALVNFALVIEVITFSDPAVAIPAMETMLVAILGLFIRSGSTPNAAADERVEQARTQTTLEVRDETESHMRESLFRLAAAESEVEVAPAKRTAAKKR